jgi:hypothetical protein
MLSASFATVWDKVNNEISLKYDIPKSQILEIWKSCLSEKLKDLEIKNKENKENNNEKETKEEKSSKNTKKSKSKDKEVKTCIHYNSRGPREGQICGKKVSKKSKSGNYCITHITQDDNIKAKVEDTKQKPIEPEKITIKMYRDRDYGWFVHKETNLVFSNDVLNKFVYAKKTQKENTEEFYLKELSDEDVETCKKLGFKYNREYFDIKKKEEENI